MKRTPSSSPFSSIDHQYQDHLARFMLESIVLKLNPQTTLRYSLFWHQPILLPEGVRRGRERREGDDMSFEETKEEEPSSSLDVQEKQRLGLEALRFLTRYAFAFALPPSSSSALPFIPSTLGKASSQASLSPVSALQLLLRLQEARKTGLHASSSHLLHLLYLLMPPRTSSLLSFSRDTFSVLNMLPDPAKAFVFSLVPEREISSDFQLARSGSKQKHAQARREGGKEEGRKEEEQEEDHVLSAIESTLPQHVPVKDHVNFILKAVLLFHLTQDVPLPHLAKLLAPPSSSSSSSSSSDSTAHHQPRDNTIGVLIQRLASETDFYATQVVAFAHGLGWTHLAAALGFARRRISEVLSVPEDLLPLTRLGLEVLSPSLARGFKKAGVKSPEELLGLEEADIAAIIQKTLPHSSHLFQPVARGRGEEESEGRGAVLVLHLAELLKKKAEERVKERTRL